MTPKEFFKRFGRETAFYYSGGVFIIHDMYKEWNVDKTELRELCKVFDCVEYLIKEYRNISNLTKELKKLDDSELFFYVFDGYETSSNKQSVFGMIDIYKELK